MGSLEDVDPKVRSQIDIQVSSGLETQIQERQTASNRQYQTRKLSRDRNTGASHSVEQASQSQELGRNRETRASDSVEQEYQS